MDELEVTQGGHAWTDAEVLSLPCVYLRQLPHEDYDGNRTWTTCYLLWPDDDGWRVFSDANIRDTPSLHLLARVRGKGYSFGEISALCQSHPQKPNTFFGRLPRRSR